MNPTTQSVKVSVILPNYNHANYLVQRIESILNQKVHEIEIIVLDDCSTDSSREILSRYQSDPRVVYTDFATVNCGSAFQQWNKGLRMAKGEFVWIAESDDYCSPDFLEKVMQPLLADDECVFSFCASRLVDTDGQDLGIFQKDRKSGVFEGAAFIRKNLCWHNNVANASAVVLRREVLQHADPFYQSFRSVGDWLLWIQLAEKGRVAYCAEPLNYFRQHGNNTTQKLMREGRSFEEYSVVLKYLKSRSHIGIWKYYAIKIRAARYIHQHFRDREKREMLFRKYDVNFFDRLLLYPVRWVFCLKHFVLKQ